MLVVIDMVTGEVIEDSGTKPPREEFEVCPEYEFPHDYREPRLEEITPTEERPDRSIPGTVINQNIDDILDRVDKGL